MGYELSMSPWGRESGDYHNFRGPLSSPGMQKDSNVQRLQNKSFLVPANSMLLWRDPTVNMSIRPRGLGSLGGCTYHLCEPQTLLLSLLTVVRLLIICYPQLGSLSLTHNTNFPSKSESVTINAKRKRHSHFPAGWWMVCLHVSPFISTASSEAKVTLTQ